MQACFHKNKKHRIGRGFTAVLTAAFLVGTAAGCQQNTDIPDSTGLPSSVTEENPEQTQYFLEKVIVLSRHQIRSPLNDGDTLQETSYEWRQWEEEPGELTEHGRKLETAMGVWFHKWMREEGVLSQDTENNPDLYRFYANSMNRTVDTAESFLPGFLPDAGIPVEIHAKPGTMDETFNPVLHYFSDSYAEKVTGEFEEMVVSEETCGRLKEDYELLESVAGCRHLNVEDTELELYPDTSPLVRGSLPYAVRISDALILQHYEETDKREVLHERELSDEEWGQIGDILHIYNEIYALPSIAVNTAHPLLEEIRNEWNDDDRKFSYFCGHDCNLYAVLGALGIENYELPDTMEKKIPCGSKIVFEKLRGSDGEAYFRAELVYQSSEQIRSETMENDPPYRYPLSFSGMTGNKDGYYRFRDWSERLEEAVSGFDELRNEQ